ncbi:MAG: ABC transporter substrate-binding protein, partial [Chloroflexota bacterium]|nr:ABC transporter substrate-binding protein [Chloroflexota bacterium]
MALLAGAVAAGCLGVESPPSPSASPASGTPSAVATAARTADELVGALPGDPEGFIPGPADDATALLGDLLYDPLYRVDAAFLPRPALASALPEVSSDGLTWTVPLRTGGSSHAGSPITAADAAFTLRLAASSTCPLERDLCAAVATNLSEASAPQPGRLVVILRAPWAPFLTRVLGTLPILSQAALTDAAQDLRDAATGLDAQEIRDRIDGITAQTSAERCLVAAPPGGCRLADHAEELEAVLSEAGVRLPPAEASAGGDGVIDEEDHAAALLEATADLAAMLGSEGIDALAAAVSLVDVLRQPLGGGPFRLDSYEAGASLELTRHEGHVPEPASLERIRLVVLRDPAVAATALRAGDVDWVVRVTPDQVAALSADPIIRIAAHPEPLIRSIIFNVHPGRVYEDAVTRRAFTMCIDRRRAAAAMPGASPILAPSETSMGSWAAAGAPPAVEPDPAEARALLEGAGWQRGSDGIYARGALRLSSEVAVRTGRADLLAFIRAAAEQLRDCGIELVVRELDLATDVLLEQLRWPNEFETLLLARPLAIDPALDFAAFEGSQATSAQHPTGANPGGHASPQLDALLVEARRVPQTGDRAGLYAQALALMAVDPPSLPIWYDVA